MVWLLMITIHDLNHIVTRQYVVPHEFVSAAECNNVGKISVEEAADGSYNRVSFRCIAVSTVKK